MMIELVNMTNTTTIIACAYMVGKYFDFLSKL